FQLARGHRLNPHDLYTDELVALDKNSSVLTRNIHWRQHIQSIYCHIAKPEVPLFNNLSKYELK
ncbi:MAG: hypothetical protein KBB64_01775, partial [Bacteroidia bacterium]|nr:hypothetical protein [Bacteroidia bacterium]